jgi:hypothetical protein
MAIRTKDLVAMAERAVRPEARRRWARRAQSFATKQPLLAVSPPTG